VVLACLLRLQLDSCSCVIVACVGVVLQLYKKAKAKGYGEHDISAVYRAANL